MYTSRLIYKHETLCTVPLHPLPPLPHPHTPQRVGTLSCFHPLLLRLLAPLRSRKRRGWNRTLLLAPLRSRKRRGWSPEVGTGLLAHEGALPPPRDWRRRSGNQRGGLGDLPRRALAPVPGLPRRGLVTGSGARQARRSGSVRAGAGSGAARCMCVFRGGATDSPCCSSPRPCTWRSSKGGVSVLRHAALHQRQGPKPSRLFARGVVLR